MVMLPLFEYLYLFWGSLWGERFAPAPTALTAASRPVFLVEFGRSADAFG